MEVLLASESGGHGSYVKKGRNRRGSIEWKISEASRGQFRGLLHKEASKEGRKNGHRATLPRKPKSGKTNKVARIEIADKNKIKYTASAR